MAGTATATKQKNTKAEPKAKAATAKKSGNQAKASGPPIAKVVGTAVRRLQHATDPAKLKTLGLLAENNHDAEAIRKASGVAADAIEAH